MARQYHYLIASLPNLIFEHEVKGFDFLQIKEYVREHIHPADYRLVELLFAPVDNQNILNIKFKEYMPFLEGGKFPNETEVKAALENPRSLLPYIAEFVKLFDKPSEEDIDNNENIQENEIDDPEKLLLQKFYTFIEKANNDFIRQWFAFDRETRNVQSAFIARKLGITIETNLIGNDDITELLTKSNAPDFALRRERDYMDKLIAALEITDILERERKLDLFRWAQIDEITTFNYFDINIILAFLLKASIVHRWLLLDAKTGAAMFEQLVNELKKTYDVNGAFAR